MSKEPVLLTKEDGFAILRFNRPEKKNAVTQEMQEIYRRMLDELSRDDGVKGLIFTGVGDSFCAGTDVSTPAADAPSSTAAAASRRLGNTDVSSTFVPSVFWTFARLARPTIAAVNGAAIGMGAEFAIQCDMRIASPNAQFGWVFPLRGLIPDTGAGTYLLPQIVGLSRALELLYSGEIIDAEEALRIGLVSKVVPAEELLDAAKELGQKITRGAPMALRMIKQLTYRSLERTIEAHQAYTREFFEICAASEDCKEGVRSFLERRAPVWTGR